LIRRIMSLNILDRTLCAGRPQSRSNTWPVWACDPRTERILLPVLRQRSCQDFGAIDIERHGPHTSLATERNLEERLEYTNGRGNRVQSF